MVTHIIVGDGAAGTAAAQAIRRRDPEAMIAVVSDDPQPHYYRAALTNYLFGQLRDEQLWGVPPDFYSRLRIGRFHGRVTAVDTEGKRVALDSGLTVPYDRLLIASGAAPGTLNVPGADLAGVVTFRTLQDARRIVDLAPDVRQAVIVGGGPLGLEWVQGLRHRGVDVVYVVREHTLLPRLLDAVASELVVRQLRDAGVTLLLGEEIAEIHRRISSHWPSIAPHMVGGVTTRTGRSIPCQLVGVAIGARPNVGFLRGSGIATNGGVLTDRHLRTTAAGVYAAGDVAHVRDARHGVDLPPAGLWQPARKQGQIAGANMASAEPVEVYDPGAILHATHLYNIDFAGVGETNLSPGENVQVMSVWPGQNAYRKLVLRDRRVIGALFIGDRSKVLLFKRLIDLGLDVTPIRQRLLDPHFDLAGWLNEQQAARTPQPMRLGGLAGRPEGVGMPAVGEAAAPNVAVPPPPAPSRRRRQAARLIAGANVHHLPVDRAATIGRDTDCDVVLGNSSVSRRHAEIAATAAGFVVRDLGSSNGTWVGLTRLHPKVPHGLVPGDTVRVGQVFLTFAAAEAQQRACLAASRAHCPIVSASPTHPRMRGASVV